MKKILMPLIVCLLVVGMTSSVSALTISGDPIEGNSWWQRFEESGVGDFDTIETFMLTTDVDFEAPGFTNFSDGSWSGGLINPDYASGTGNTVDLLQWDIGFSPAQSTPFTFEFFAYQGETLKETANVSWSGSGWTIDILNSDGCVSVVPIPTTMLLLGSGLLGLVGIRRKFRKR